MRKTLHLNLKKKWFDMVLSGEKKEEYREIKPYWTKRLKDFLVKKTFDTITFSNGYTKNRPQFEIELKEIVFEVGNTYWGADYGKEYYVFKLGKIL